MNIDEVGVNAPVIVPPVKGNGPSVWNVIVDLSAPYTVTL